MSSYTVRSTTTTRGETRWMVIGPGNWIVSKRHLTRAAAIDHAATLSTFQDPRYESAKADLSRVRREIAAEHAAVIDAEGLEPAP